MFVFVLVYVLFLWQKRVPKQASPASEREQRQIEAMEWKQVLAGEQADFGRRQHIFQCILIEGLKQMCRTAVNGKIWMFMIHSHVEEIGDPAKKPKTVWQLDHPTAGYK